MSADALWQIAMRFLHPSSKSAGFHLELMSNDDLDRWLEEHRLR
jgi:hypothetical protein